MGVNIDSGQIGRTLGHLGRLGCHDNHDNVNVLASPGPAWLRMGAWEAILDGLESQRSREPAAHPLRSRVGDGMRYTATLTASLRVVSACGAIGPDATQQLSLAGNAA